MSEGAEHKVYVVIDVGCHECGVGSVEVGIYGTREEAQAAADQRDEDTGRWRDGGQTYCEVFEFSLPAPIPVPKESE